MSASWGAKACLCHGALPICYCLTALLVTGLLLPVCYCPTAMLMYLRLGWAELSTRYACCCLTHAWYCLPSACCCLTHAHYCLPHVRCCLPRACYCLTHACLPCLPSAIF